MKFAIQDVPEELSNHSIIAPGSGTRDEVVNPIPSTQPNPNMGAATGSQLLYDLAVKDGWAGLYDPGNPESIILDSSGTVLGFRDLMGNFPDLVEYIPYPTANLGSVGSFVTTSISTASSTEEFDVPENLTIYGVQTRFLTQDTFYFGTTISNPKLTTNRLYFSQPNFLTVSAGTGINYLMSNIHQEPGQIIAFNTQSKDTWIGFQPTNNIRARYDNPSVPDKDNGFYFTGPKGPIIIAEGDVPTETHERMVELLSQLSGIPVGLKADVPNPPRTFCTLDEQGNIVSAFCPYRADYVASIDKVINLWVHREYIPDSQLDNMYTISNIDYVQNNPEFVLGDQISLRDLMYASIMLSSNTATRELQRYTGRLIDPNTTDPRKTFYEEQTRIATELGWTNFHFQWDRDGPNQIPDWLRSYSTSYDNANLLRQIKTERPWIYDVMGTWNHDFTIIRGGDTLVLNYNHVNSPITSVKSQILYPELEAVKGGATDLFQNRSLLTAWENPVTQTTQFTCMLRAGIYDNNGTETANMRAIFEAAKYRNSAPVGYSSDNGSILSWDRSATGQNRVVATRPYSLPADPIKVAPFDFISHPHPVVNTGESVRVRANVRGMKAPHIVRGTARVIGGSFDNSTGEISQTTSSASSFAQMNFTGSVRRGGLLDVDFSTTSTSPQDALWLRNVTVEIISDDRVIREYVVDVVDYSFTESSQSNDSNDSSGSVGEFSVALTTPALDSVIRRYGVGYLRGRKSRLITTHGNVLGTIKGVEETDYSTIRISGVSEMEPLNAYNVQAPPFEGSLVQLIQLYFGLVSEAAPQFQVDPRLQGRRIVAPGWNGELWYHLKLLCAAERIQISISPTGGVYISPSTPDKSDPHILSSHGVSYAESSIAEFVEVYKYDNEWRENSIAYPIGGWTEDTEILSVKAGEEAEYNIELSASLVEFQPPQLVDFVASTHTSGSVYTVLGDDDGFPITPAQWTRSGGSVTFELNPDTTSIKVKMKGATGIVTGTGDPIRSFSLALAADTGGSRYSTLRILGTGTFFERTVLKFPTGVPSDKTGTEVGATIDNPFISTMSQAVKAGSLSAYKFSGSVPSVQTSSPSSDSIQIGHSTLTQLIEGKNEDFRVREVTYSPGTVTITGDYHLTWGNWEESLGTQTYQSITDANIGLGYREVQDRGKLYV